MLTFSSTRGTTVTSPARDNGDGSYTVAVDWNPSSGNRPGVIIGQPGRDPVVVSEPTSPVGERWNIWMILFWLMFVIAVLLLLALIFK
jgi:hypothetical protein